MQTFYYNIDSMIELQNLFHGIEQPFGHIYNLLQNKLITLREYIDKNLVRGTCTFSQKKRMGTFMCKLSRFE